MKSLLVILALCTLGMKANAQAVTPELVEIPLKKAYIPMGFDSNDPKVQIMIEGELPNTCYRLGPTEVKYEETTGKLSVAQHAYFYKGICLQVLVPFNKTIDFGMMSRGDYKVVDGHTDKFFGSLPVSQALTDSPDDYIYAIVEDAHLGVQDNEKAIILRGQLPGNCWSLKETKVIVENEDVVTLLPVMTYTHGGDQCTRVSIPFVTSVKLPELKKGRYMIQVRSLNGHSVNKLFDL